MAIDVQTDQEMYVKEPGPLPKELWPSVDHLVTEDGKPVDNIFSEKQQRLLTEPLYSSWHAEEPFLALANVGLFYSTRIPPYVPDMFLSLNVKAPESLFPKSNRSYFVWEYGKVPEVVIEIVSNREGNEDGDKLLGYARVGIPFYVIYDPGEFLRTEKLRFFELRGGLYEQIHGECHLMASIGLGLKLWEGNFEGHADRWLRWTDLAGNLISTGAELAASEQQRADAEQQRADAEQQRADAEQQRADAGQQRADAEQQRADAEQQRADAERDRADAEAMRANSERERAEKERQRAEQLIEQLRQLGIEPEGKLYPTDGPSRSA